MSASKPPPPLTFDSPGASFRHPSVGGDATESGVEPVDFGQLLAREQAAENDHPDSDGANERIVAQSSTELLVCIRRHLPRAEKANRGVEGDFDELERLLNKRHPTADDLRQALEVVRRGRTHCRVVRDEIGEVSYRTTFEGE